MLRGLFRLTWLEIKIFLREPLGALGVLVAPVLGYLVIGRLVGRPAIGPRPEEMAAVSIIMPVLFSLLIGLSAVISLVTIVAVYREGGILKRLRATPLRPQTILVAHVVVKLIFTVVTMAAMMLAGRRYFPATGHIPFASLTLALLAATTGILSIGFVIASVVPTARFAQPVASVVFYPMVALSGLFFPIAALPPVLRAVARVLPLTYAVSLLRGIAAHDRWSSHVYDLAALAIYCIVFTALSARIFRWE
jgi:ABC-2 type transport system permease protein